MIVVGYDGSDCAHVALDNAIELAKELDDELLITYGYEPGGSARSTRRTARP